MSEVLTLICSTAGGAGGGAGGEGVPRPDTTVTFPLCGVVLHALLT